MGSAYSAHESLRLSPKYMLLLLSDPGSYRIVPSAGRGTPSLILTSSVIPLPVFLLSGVFQLSQFWRLIHRQALGSGNWWGCGGRSLESPVRVC